MARDNRKAGRERRTARTAKQAAVAPVASAAPRDTSRKEIDMQDAKTQEVVTQTLETMTFWAEANQRALNQMVELGTGAAKESVKLYAELQQGALDAFREHQATALRWQSSWQDAPRDPMAWYQKALADSVDGAQKWFRMIESNAQAVTKSAERMQVSAEQTGRGIQQTFGEVVNRTKDVYTRS